MPSSFKDILFCLLALLTFKTAKAIDCYQCLNIQNITDCHTLVQCNPNEYCFSETTGQGIYTRFTLGCRLKHTCLTAVSSTTSSPLSIIGRSIEAIDCSQCCAVDACNKQLCTTGSKALDSNTCQDDPTFNCANVASTFNICSDIRHAKLKCKYFCGLCNLTDGHWSDWQSWSSCSVSCGLGTQTRIRFCNNPAPSDGGLDCTGLSDQRASCNLRSCPVHGGWSLWSSWGTCSLTCGIGLERRDRSCSNPYPGPDGEPCWGDARDDRACFYRACADGYWSRWTNWGSCTATCQGGIQSRRRTCTNPSPSKFGHDCVGNSEETTACNTNACPRTQGGWSSWSSWSSCNNFLQKRTRSCNHPTPTVNGQACIGSSEQVIFCGDFDPPFIRLVGGSSSRSGRVEVKYGGVWGTVCDDGFNNNAAKVVCRSLGFSTSSASFHNNAGSGRIWLDDISCTGSEKSLELCNHLPWGKHNCGHGEDVSVTC